MALFVLGDPHLSLGASKPMDIFPGWNDYVDRLEKNWRKLITPQDTIAVSYTHLDVYKRQAFYDVTYHEDGTVKAITPNEPGIPARITKAIIKVHLLSIHIYLYMQGPNVSQLA